MVKKRNSRNKKSGKPRSETRAATEANGEVTELHDVEKGDLPCEEQNQEAKEGPGKSVAENFVPGRKNLAPEGELGLSASAAPQLAHGDFMEPELTPSNNAKFRQGLAETPHSESKASSSIEDINAETEDWRNSTALTPSQLNDLLSAHYRRFQRLGELSDLCKAVEYGVRAVSSTPDSHPDKPAMLNNLGISYESRYDYLGDISDLRKAIQCEEQAVSLSPSSHPDRASRFNNLGISYRRRFERLGDVSDMKRATTCGNVAVSLTPDRNLEKPGYFSNLGNAYLAWFDHLGDLSHLSKAIDCQSEAAWLTPEGHPEKPGRLHNLAVSHHARYERLGDLSDLARSIVCGVKAVSLVPDDHPHKPRILHGLESSYMKRFKYLGDISDLQKAIECGKQTLHLTPEGHQAIPLILNSLGLAHKSRFHQLGDMTDLSIAIEHFTKAVLLTPEEHPEKPAYLINLGNLYRDEFERLGKVSDLNYAIECGAQAVSLAPDGHSQNSEYLNDLGHLYQNRFECLGELSDMKNALSTFKRAALSPTGSPLTRFRACRHWAALSPSSAPHPAYNLAMKLLPQIFWIGTTVYQRYDLMGVVGDFATEAVSNAISFGDYRLALEWLEAGRSIVWGQISQLRSPFDQLFTKNPELADKLREVGRQLDHAGSQEFSPDGGRDLAGEASTRMQLALDWDRLLAEARSVPGFEDFLCPPKSSRLLGSASSHPIAIINTHESRCDALVLQPGSSSIAHCPLPEFSVKNAMMARENLASLVGQRGFVKTNHTGSTKNESNLLEESLKDLWLGVVKPVLDFLGFTHAAPVEQLPCITWCTTGVLSFLPLHAAGCYNQPNSNAFDLVVSSYTPTLSALLASQSQIPHAKDGILAVGQVHTSGFNNLPCVSDELNAIKHHTEPGRYIQLEGDEATVDRVLHAMERSGWVHLACHGTQHLKDPTQSAFHLRDGPLTLATIAKRSFTNKGLAFLSACHTAAGDENMPDEAVHLAAGMLMVGYPSVIGTMWSIADEDGPEVANQVYAELLKDEKMNHTKAARALHKAVAGLRTKVGKKALDRWAPFVHLGS